MAADYHRFYPRLWRETREWPDDQQKVVFYLLTCRHKNTEGLYELPTEYACADLGWEPQRFEDAVAGVAEREWVVRDGDLVFVPQSLVWQPPSSPNTLKGAARAVAGIPRDSKAYAAFYQHAGLVCPELSKLLKHPLPRYSEAPSELNLDCPPTEVLASPFSDSGSPFEASSSSSPSTSSSTSGRKDGSAQAPQPSATDAVPDRYPWLDVVDSIAIYCTEHFPGSPFPAAWAASRSEVGAILTMQSEDVRVEIRSAVTKWLIDEAPTWHEDKVNVRPTIAWARAQIRDRKKALTQGAAPGGHRPATAEQQAAGQARMAAFAAAHEGDES